MSHNDSFNDSYVRSRMFCLCLPVRFGVFLLSLLALAGGGFVAVIGWIQLSHLKQRPLGKTDEIALWIQSLLFSLLAVLSLLGFLGAITRRRGIVSGFAIGIAIHLGLNIAAGCFSIYTIFARDSQAALDSCLQKANDKSNATMQSCMSSLLLINAMVMVMYVLTWLIQLYAYFVVVSYMDQLDEESLFENPVDVPRMMVMQGGYPRASVTSTYSGSAPTYPFTQPRQAYNATGRGQVSNYMA